MSVRHRQVNRPFFTTSEFGFNRYPYTPYKPVLLTPNANSELTDFSPTFTWQNVTGATSYDIQIASNLDFSTIVDSATGLTNTNFTSITFTNAASYYWRVRARRNLVIGQWSVIRTFFLSYEQLTLDISPGNIIGLWKLNETSGTNANDSSPENNDGTYFGTTLDNADFLTLDGTPLFDGTTDTVNIYSSAFNTDFTPALFTISAWFKIQDNSVWSDGVDRRIITLLADGSNFIFIRKATTSNTINMIYDAGGTVKQVQTGSQTSLDWIHFALTVNVAGNRLKSYINGVQVGSTQTSLGTWAGALGSASTAIGSGTSTGSANVCKGWISYVSVFKSELDSTQIAKLAIRPERIVLNYPEDGYGNYGSGY